MYQITQIGFIALSLLCLALIYQGLHQALSQSDFPLSKQKRIKLQFLLLVGSWIVGISMLAQAGFFADFSQFPPRMMLALVLPMVTMIGLTLFSKNLAVLLRHVPPAHLLYIQSFRVGVEILIWLLFIQDLLPIQMTFEGYNFDVLSGLTAPLFAYYCFTQRKWSKRIAILWNLGGLVLLFTIVTIALLSFPTPMRYFMNEPANTIVTQFPFVWLPAVLVTIAYSMHFLSLKQLLMRGGD